MSRTKTKDLLTTPIIPTLTRMTIPTTFGIVSILLFNLVDAYFIGLIGPKELAAVSFTFPVTNVLMNISMGLGVGTAIHISSRIGRGDITEARLTAAHALILGVCIAIPLGLLGNLTLYPLFSILGADLSTIGLIDEYMSLLYSGFGFLVVAMMGNNVMRATGDTKTPSITMAVAGLTNGIMDPLLIFGIGPFPELGIRGAALATVLSWMFSSFAVVYILIKRKRLMALSDLLGKKWARWQSILQVAIPATATNLMMPLAAAVLTAMAARQSPDAVAGFGVGTRIEALSFVVIIALSSALTPFIGQNFGAGNSHRIRESLKAAITFSIAWSVFIAGLLYFSSHWIAAAFTSSPATRDAIALYLTIVPFCYAFQSIVTLSCSALNALHRPLYGTLISLLRLFLLALPLAWLGSWLFGLTGFFSGIALGNGLAGILTLLWLIHQLPRLSTPKST